MRLTSLEIKGFKSFGDKVTIHFDKGVTAIVGPNGSGKSNVVDAIRWVLGEQKTRMLRSEKMENVIFNGTRNRKPSNLAEVHLTFENNKGILSTEYSTVCISRKLYRTGDSEYLLNGVTCRLKDITDLFLDTGIGPDSYAIIELKMIDDILNDRNNTIKLLLEEAAGISKYKIRKKQTFARLEETDADLNRVNDLMFEIEKSLKQLESQAKKTQKFYRLKDEYKEVSMAYSLYAIREFRQSLIDLEQREAKVQDEKLQHNVDLDVSEANIQRLKSESEEKEKAFSDIQKELNEFVLQITKAENEKRNISEKIGFLHDKKKQLHHQNTTDQSTIEELNESIVQLAVEKETEEDVLRTLESQLSEMKQNLEDNKVLYDESVNELRQLTNGLHEIRQEINRYETQAAVREARVAGIAEELKRLNDQIVANESKLSQVQEALGTAVPGREKLESDVASIRNNKETAEKTITSTEQTVRELNQKLAEAKRLSDVKTNEYELTRNLLERMEGYPESIRFLKSSGTRLSKAPLVSDLISCNDDYKFAIENYLEPFLNHFVVSDHAEAWEALQMLNNSSKGRANFFVLSSLSKVTEPSHLNIPGCVPALKFTDFDQAYNKLFTHLLGHVYIHESAEDLTHIDTSGLPSGYVILSRNGRFLRQRYAMGGGSIGMSDGKRTGKQKNLDKLSLEIEQHREDVSRFQDQLENAESQLQQSRTSLHEINRELMTAESDLSGATGRISTLLNNKEFVTAALEYNKSTVNQLREEQELLSNPAHADGELHGISIDNRRSELQQLLDQQKVKQDLSNDLQKHVSDMSNAVNHKNIQFFQQQNKIQNIIRDSSFKSNQIATLQRNREDQMKELEAIAGQLEQLDLHAITLKEELETLTTKKESTEIVVREKETAYYKSKGEIDQHEKSVHEKRKQKEHSDALIHQIQTEINELKLRMNSLKERLNIEFNIDINDIMDQEPDPELNSDELRERSDKLKNQLSGFGPINPMALESFKEIKERHDFILKEQEDLKAAKESLLKTIAEIDLTAREKFMDAYHKIRENFIHVFRSLFSDEDNCDLVLTDLANPLESDVQIIAQPKGKKPLSIHQLSGGEKTLTATALLFSIYLLKPSPFCIFDEVDAPLDDANIDKFNRIIQKFSADSQFIIITHNKKTMASTDIMYGVTMVEQGVTQLVPVDLREYA